MKYEVVCYERFGEGSMDEVARQHFSYEAKAIRFARECDCSGRFDRVEIEITGWKNGRPW